MINMHFTYQWTHWWSLWSTSDEKDKWACFWVTTSWKFFGQQKQRRVNENPTVNMSLENTQGCKVIGGTCATARGNCRKFMVEAEQPTSCLYQSVEQSISSIFVLSMPLYGVYIQHTCISWGVKIACKMVTHSCSQNSVLPFPALSLTLLWQCTLSCLQM